MKRYVECERGKNRIQTSLTLNQETEENGTMVVPGFHKRILEWWGGVVKKGESEAEVKFRRAINHDENTLKTDKIYMPADTKKYGRLVPAVCGPSDIRISRPEILHGSTANKDGVAETRCWVVNPWFVGVQDDHQTLNVPESGSWSSVAAMHRDLVVTNGTPSRQINMHGFPPYRFPAAVSMRNISALSDALVGQRRWDDPVVVIERNWLLGPDEDAAWKFVEHCRGKMKREYKRNMTLVRRLEKEYYGENSFYYHRETGQYVEPEQEEEEDLTGELDAMEGVEIEG